MSISQPDIDTPNLHAATYDLASTLFASGRLFDADLSDGHVLFNPDRRGLPIVVNDWVAELVRNFTGGMSVGRALSTLPRHVDFDKALDVTEYLESGGYLRAEQTPARYTAGEFSSDSTAAMNIWVHINNHCNPDCEYCFVDKFKSTMRPEIVAQTVDHIRSTVEKRRLREVLVKFAGGEPTLSLATMVDFHSRLRAALDPLDVNLHFGILSNGTILYPELLDFIKRANATMAISLDGYGAETHDIYRVYKTSRRGSWERIIKNIETLKAESIPISINATISEQSCGSLPELLQWIVENGFRTRISVVRQPNGSWKPGPREEEYARLTGALIKAFDEALAELEKPRYNVNLRSGMGICELNFETPVTTACCGIATNHVVIQDDGRLASCPMTVRENSVPASSDLFSAARLTFRHRPESRNEDADKNCLDCRWFPVCTSGCPVTNFRIKGKAFTISPLHAFYDFIIPRYIQFFGRKLLQMAERQNVGDFCVIDLFKGVIG